ncbi:MAG: glutathione S-transferase family protein [Stenotrophomonas nitritireducens]|uniref:glutathione S-transferase family protein n=1 Tax=Stenotrophomonas nitritireducens TaxID=83617 RepID=UPI001AD3982A|nr:glutathione S-transferase family protein [Stenotrophomonas nitritireducens]MBN8790922.1 glutathione S-transferase family protein [Stenotrophomonas nitritireducens]MBN8796688.1 glutathione S-transferase family protein [Stenotrophomonas nitritireducens]
MTTLTFYTHPFSRGRVARWMLEETGLPYEEVILDYGTTMKAPGYLAVNPMGKVPALRHDDTVVTESAAICLHLAELVPEKKLLPPPGSPERGACYRWMLFAAGPLESFITARRHGALAPPVEAGYGNEADLMRTLEGAVAGRKHLVGDRFTVADLYLAALLGYYMRIGELAPTPAFEAYAATHLQRPAALRANAHDDALVAARAEGA